MNDIRLGVVETRFADIVWQNEPIPSGKLKEICEKELNWKKSTTYTVLEVEPSLLVRPDDDTDEIKSCSKIYISRGGVSEPA